MAGEIDTQTVIDSVLPSLHSDSRANLTYWAETDLIQWIDEGLKRVSRVAGLWVERDTSQNTGEGARAYSLPARHVATLHVSVDLVPLRPASTIELEMRDPAYQDVAGVPDHWYEDQQGPTLIALTPVPNATTSLAIVHTCWPPEVDTTKNNTLVQAPAPLAGYLAQVALAKAYAREGEMEMPDVAQHCAARVQMYEQVFTRYFGAGA